MKIVLVEDALSVAQVMTLRLKSYGHEVVHAENGQKAVSIFEAICPDLILMDIETLMSSPDMALVADAA